MDTVIIRGGGDLASGIAHRLYRAGFNIIILEIKEPLSIRRKVCFSEAVYSQEIEIEGVKAVLAKDIGQVHKILGDSNIAVYVDPFADIVNSISPLALIDATMAKRNLGTNREMAPITIAIGPGFEASKDVDLVIETKRGHYLGRVIHEGKAIANTGIPGDVLGFKEERIIRAGARGRVENFLNLGDSVQVNDLICRVGGVDTRANIPGIIRGLIKEGLEVEEGLKIGDIDPRGIKEYTYTISEKARAIGGGVLEGIMFLKKERKI